MSATDHVEAIRERTLLGMPTCTHGTRLAYGEDACPACLCKWGDDRSMDVAHLLRVIDELRRQS